MATLPQQLIEHPLLPAQPVWLAPGVRRLVANNPGPMTGPGTNCYVLGERALAVIDPGPLDPAMLDALCSLGQIRWVLVTHTHRDHSPNARLLADRTGAQLIGAHGPEDGHQDLSLVPDQPLYDGFELSTDEFCLRAVHTPGHVANHYCFWLTGHNWLFSGDHIMQGATVVIIPPSGDMKAYIDSVETLCALPIAVLAPGHGHLLGQVQPTLRALIAHRLAREAKVLAALQQFDQPATLAQLTPFAYADVDPSLHPVAAYSLWAHLLKLEQEQQVIQFREQHWLFDQAHWQLRRTEV